MRFFALSLLFFTFSFVIHAQSEQAETWPVIEHCVSEPTNPPDDWSFEGTIIMAGYAGLHGYSYGWETPRVLVFLSPQEIDNGTLSPDGHHYVVPHEEVFFHGGGLLLSTTIHINQIDVYEVTPIATRTPIFTTEWDLTYTTGSNGFSRKVAWLDNERFMFEVGTDGGNIAIVNFKNNERQLWQHPQFYLTDSPYFVPAPDWTIASGSDPLDKSYWFISDLQSGETLTRVENINIWRASWAKNSQQAILYHSPFPNNEENPHRQLMFTDRAGNIQVLTYLEENTYLNNMAWSPNNHYVAYTTDTLHLISIEDKQIVDTCLSIDSDSLIWSPDSTQIALHQRGSGYTPLLIYDTVRQVTYTVARHYGREILGWRAD